MLAALSFNGVLDLRSCRSAHARGHGELRRVGGLPLNRMSVSHVYQPMLIRALVDAGGSATLRQLARTFLLQERRSPPRRDPASSLRQRRQTYRRQALTTDAGSARLQALFHFSARRRRTPTRRACVALKRLNLRLATRDPRPSHESPLGPVRPPYLPAFVSLAPKLNDSSRPLYTSSRDIPFVSAPHERTPTPCERSCPFNSSPRGTTPAGGQMNTR